jgi:hypothetical protein
MRCRQLERGCNCGSKHANRRRACGALQGGHEACVTLLQHADAKLI